MSWTNYFYCLSLFTSTLNAHGQVPRGLRPGDLAPAITVSKWIKGAPVAKLKRGNVYVVEFWATWCLPCRQSSEHLSALSKNLNGKATILGISILEKKGTNVSAFVKSMAGKMTYPLATDKLSSKAPTGVMATSWMESQTDGIPAAFIIDRGGRVAWIGYPMEMDAPLKEVIDGTYDLKTYAKQYQARGIARGQFLSAASQGDRATADSAAEAFLKNSWSEPHALMVFSWIIAVPSSELKYRNSKVAIRAAERANELYNGKDASTLYALALSYFLDHNKEKAVEAERQAIAMAEPWAKPEFEALLKKIQAST